MGKPKAKAIELAKDFKKKARSKFDIEKLILFGSQATGQTREGSDIDLLIVSKKLKKRAEFMSQLFKEWHIVQKKNEPVDFICYTPQEFAEMRKKITIVKQAAEEGMEI